MLRCAQLGLHDSDLDGLTVGMVYDMIIEQMNDSEEYAFEATQEDIYTFFGR